MWLSLAHRNRRFKNEVYKSLGAFVLVQAYLSGSSEYTLCFKKQIILYYKKGKITGIFTQTLKSEILVPIVPVKLLVELMVEH